MLFYPKSWCPQHAVLLMPPGLYALGPLPITQAQGIVLPLGVSLGDASFVVSPRLPQAPLVT